MIQSPVLGRFWAHVKMVPPARIERALLAEPHFESGETTEKHSITTTMEEIGNKADSVQHLLPAELGKDLRKDLTIG